MRNNLRPAVVALGAVLVAMMFAACSGSAPTANNAAISIAIWDPEDLSPMQEGRPGMAEVLAGQIAARMADMPVYQVVERQHLLKALEELHLGSSELADPQTRLKLGRIIGAQQMVFGAFQAVGNMLRLDLRRVDVASGKILKTATATTTIKDVNGWLQAADQAAGELVK